MFLNVLLLKIKGKKKPENLGQQNCMKIPN